MLPSVLVGVVVAVFCPDQVVLVDLGRVAVTARIALPAAGAAVFAAPDGRLLVPLAGEDATLVIKGSAVVERWRGRLFPLFFDEPDHVHVVLPDALVTLSYPERLPLTRVPIPGLGAIRRAAVNRDGRLVAVAPAADGARTLLIVAAVEGGSARRVMLGGDARLLAYAEDGGFALVATGPSVVEFAAAGQTRAQAAPPLDGAVTALAVTGRREAVVGIADGSGGALIGLKVDAAGRPPLKPKFRTPLAAAPTALRVAGESVVAVGGGELVVLAKRGRRVRQTLALPGAFDLAMMPEVPASTLPAWSDAPPH